MESHQWLNSMVLIISITLNQHGGVLRIIIDRVVGAKQIVSVKHIQNFTLQEEILALIGFCTCSFLCDWAPFLS